MKFALPIARTLEAVAVGGLLLAACGGNGTGSTTTRPTNHVTSTTMASTSTTIPETSTTGAHVATTVAGTSTTVAPTTTIAATTTTAAPTTTIAATTTTASPTTTVAPTTTEPTTTSTVPTSSGSSSSRAWIWIILGVALIALIVTLVVVGQNKKRQQNEFATSAKLVSDRARQMADSAREIPVGNEPSALAIWWQLIETKASGLAEALTALAPPAEGSLEATAVASVLSARDELLTTISHDRTLRMGPPAPTEQQITYSAGAIREAGEKLRASASNLDQAVTPTVA